MGTPTGTTTPSPTTSPSSSCPAPWSSTTTSSPPICPWPETPPMLARLGPALAGVSPVTPLVESLPSSGWWRTGPSSPTPTVTTSTASSGPASSALTPPVVREPATETPVVLSTCPTAPRALATSGSRSVLSPSEPPLVARSATPPGSPGLSTTWTGCAPRPTVSAARQHLTLPPSLLL